MGEKHIKVTDPDILDRIKEIYIKLWDEKSVFGRALVEVNFEHNLYDIFYIEGYSNLIFIKYGNDVDLYIRNEDAIYENCAPYKIYRR